MQKDLMSKTMAQFRYIKIQPETINITARLRGINSLVIYLDSVHLTKRALWLVDSWSRAPDQIQMYPDRDSIPLLLPSQLFVCFAVIVEGKV